MKKLLLSVFALLAVGYAKADDKAWFLKTDTQVRIPVESVDYFLAADDDDHFTVVVKEGEPVANIKRVTFDQQTTGIESVYNGVGKEKVVLPTKASRCLQISGLACGTEVGVYSVDGKLIKNAVSTGDALNIDVSDMAKGTYVLKTKQSKVKFVKQ